MSGRLVLVRHGQSRGNVDRRLDTLPPGAELTELGREQARTFGRGLSRRPGIVAHSIATRAVQTASEIHQVISPSARVGARALDGIHEVQVGELENRNDDEAHDEFNAIYRRWHGGELDVAMPGGESGRDVLDRYVPVLDALRAEYLDHDTWREDIVVVSHGAAIRLIGALLSDVASDFAVDHHLANTEAVILAPEGAGRWSCVQWGVLTPPFGPEPAVVTDPGRSTDPMG
ncbi:histidine phosphatase family protein [Mycobacterium sp. SMC-4]|uniref:histidine phosphatase family protein n=1 Tax=Mycobacterium sp. SMC-4 TaxID=2857059 RepID=UPI003D02BD06